MKVISEACKAGSASCEGRMVLGSTLWFAGGVANLFLRFFPFWLHAIEYTFTWSLRLLYVHFLGRGWFTLNAWTDSSTGKTLINCYLNFQYLHVSELDKFYLVFYFDFVIPSCPVIPLALFCCMKLEMAGVLYQCPAYFSLSVQPSDQPSTSALSKKGMIAFNW